MRQGAVVTVVLPVIDETWSLEDTIRILLEENFSSIKELLIVTASRTTKDSLDTISRLQSAHPTLVRVHQQSLPFLGGALREAFDIASGDFTVLMSSDLETDPHLVKQLINEMNSETYDIVSASRWLHKGSFHDYGVFKKFVINYMFQKVFSFVFGTPLSDMTFGFRIYKTEILRRIKWEELKHAFLFESMVKPLRVGYSVKEVPCRWEPRREGRSHNPFSSYLGYVRIGLKSRFAPVRDLVITQ